MVVARPFSILFVTLSVNLVQVAEVPEKVGRVDRRQIPRGEDAARREVRLAGGAREPLLPLHGLLVHEEPQGEGRPLDRPHQHVEVCLCFYRGRLESRH